ncbi:MAG TPA: hypothetical protein VGM03_02450, partial [Phycisphaerae bacterium]
FMTTLDFGAASFNGDARWLSAGARAGGAVGDCGSGTYTVLTPRQPLTATPYAVQTRGIFVDSSNRVGIGTTAPSDPLNIKAGPGGGYLSLRNSNDSERWRLRLDDSHNLVVSAGGADRVKFGQSPGSDPVLTVYGTTRTNVLQIVGGSDIAEPFNVQSRDREGAESRVAPGMVVSINPARVGELRLSSTAYDATVAGVISGAGGVKAGLTLQQFESAADGKHPVALTGRVWCWCDADAGGAIRAGDLLTTSDTPGHAMRVQDRARAGGAMLGKAMSSLESGKGLVLVLVNLQ